MQMCQNISNEIELYELHIRLKLTWDILTDLHWDIMTVDVQVYVCKWRTRWCIFGKNKGKLVIWRLSLLQATIVLKGNSRKAQLFTIHAINIISHFSLTPLSILKFFFFFFLNSHSFVRPALYVIVVVKHSEHVEECKTIEHDYNAEELGIVARCRRKTVDVQEHNYTELDLKLKRNIDIIFLLL